MVVGEWQAFDHKADSIRTERARFERAPEREGEIRQVLRQSAPAWILLGGGIVDRILLDRVNRIRHIAPESLIAALGRADDAERAERWLRRGARVYLASAWSAEEVGDRLLYAQEHQCGIVDECFMRLAWRQRLELLAERRGSLSEREEEVLRLICQGASNPVIARRLNISCGTVEAHVGHILAKLNVNTRVEAIERARILGMR